MNNWQTKNLKDISESIQYGFTESSTLNEVGPKFLRITDIQDYKVNWRNVPFCKIDDKIKSKYLLKDGDLLFARTGATVGKSFLIKGEIPESVFASYLIRVRVKQGLFDKYLSNFFNSPQYWSQITEGQVGIGQPNVNGTKLGQLQIPLPDLTTQQAIVSKIEELFSDLDKGIEDLKKAQQQLKTFRQSVLKWAFEGKLTNENVKKGKLPKGWEMKKLGDVCEMKAGNFVQANLIEQEKKEDNYRCYGGNGLRGYVQSFTHDGRFALIGRQGALCGNVHFVEGVFHATEHAVVVTSKSQIEIKCLYYKLVEMKLNKHASGVAQPGLSVNKILPLEIMFPQKIEEQERIVQEIESRLSVADKMEEGIAESLQKAESLRQSILKKAFSGELV
jgi:type I restriction enzyme S subunit